MKILKIRVKGLKLFDNVLELDFYAKQRVSSEKNEMLTNINSNIYINNVISLAGINASGKTTTLKVILFALQLLEGKPINVSRYSKILEGLTENEEVVFDIFFVTAEGKLSRLNTVIKSKISKSELNNKYYIASESIWTKSANSARSKNSMFDFSEIKPELKRNNDELFLLEDVSIIIAYNKQNNTSIDVIDSMDWTDFNALRVLGTFPLTLVRFLDHTIEDLSCKVITENKKIEIRLKFYGKEEIIIHDPFELNGYLSSGTVKGINVFMTAMIALQEGRYLIIDELENHFNKEIVSTLIRFFMDHDINKKGAVLIFSTHYVELLDIFERNDNIYIVRNSEGITVENFSDISKRNDGKKKSELFQSGFLENTTPDYEAYIKLKHTMINVHMVKEV